MPQLTEWAAWANIITVPIAVAAILVSIALSLWSLYRTKQKRALACEFQSIDFPIEVRAGEALDGDIEIRYKKRAVDNLFLVRFRLKNTGNLAIREEHVVEPVKFTFGPDTKILRPPKLLDKKPKNLKTSWDDYTELVSLWDEVLEAEIQAEFILLHFELLNPGDEFTTEVYVLGKIRCLK